MKCFLTLLLIIAAYSVRAQDTIRLIKGNYLLVNIDTVTKYDIRYRKFEDKHKVKHSVSKSVVSNITYADGRSDTLFVLDESGAILKRSPMLHVSDEAIYELGRHDAQRYYDRYSSASTGTLLATFPGSPLLGLIVGSACSLTPPKDKNLDIPNTALAGNTSYHDGYFTKANRIKSGKVWTSFGMGVLLNLAVYAILKGKN